MRICRRQSEGEADRITAFVKIRSVSPVGPERQSHEIERESGGLAGSSLRGTKSIRTQESTSER